MCADFWTGVGLVASFLEKWPEKPTNGMGIGGFEGKYVFCGEKSTIGHKISPKMRENA